MADSRLNSLVFYGSDQTNVLLPIKNSIRVNYTCFHVCHSYVAFGSSSGGVYLFAKCGNSSYRYAFTVLNNAGAITCVAFAPDDQRLLAIATNKGHLMVVELTSDNESADSVQSWNMIYECSHFADNCVQTLKWDEFSDYRLYMSDDKGNVFVLHSVKSMTNLMILPLPSLLLRTGSKIFQLDIGDHLLVISTSNKSFIYDLQDASLTQIGKKPRSNGQYGVCFFPKQVNHNRVDGQRLCIFTSRPHSRLWEADLSGDVQFTHHFKESLVNQNPELIVNSHENSMTNETTTESTAEVRKSATFAKLCVVSANTSNTCNTCNTSNIYLLTYSNTPKTCIYVIDPIRANIVCWCHFDANHIYDIYCIDNHVYLIYTVSTDGKLRFTQLSLLALDECLNELCQNNATLEAAQFVVNHVCLFTNMFANNHFTEFNIRDMLENIWSHLNDNQKQMFDQIEYLINSKKDNSRKSSQSYAQTMNSLENSFSLESDENTMAYNASNTELFHDFESQFIKSGADMMDIGFSELKKLKDIVISKFSVSAINAKIHSDQNENQMSSEISANIQNNSKTDALNESIEKSNEKDYLVLLKDLSIELIESKYIEECKCKCGFPLPGSHLRQSRVQEKMQQLIVQMTAIDHSLTQLIDICFDNALWPTLIRLLLKANQSQKYVDYSLMLCDIDLLTRVELRQYLICTKNFEDLFTKFSKQRPNGIDGSVLICINCGQTVNNINNNRLCWETIVKLCIASIGVEESMTLFALFIDTIPRFSTEFYLLLLRMLMICVYQSPTTRKKLDKLRSYLNVITKEQSKSLSLSVSSNDNQDNGSYKINLSNTKCEKCAKSLNIISNTEKIVVFNCRHFYHKSCISQSYCFLCK